MRRDWVLELYLAACEARRRMVPARGMVVPIEVGRALRDPEKRRAAIRGRKKRNE